MIRSNVQAWARMVNEFAVNRMASHASFSLGKHISNKRFLHFPENVFLSASFLKASKQILSKMDVSDKDQQLFRRSFFPMSCDKDVRDLVLTVFTHTPFLNM